MVPKNCGLDEKLLSKEFKNCNVDEDSNNTESNCVQEIDIINEEYTYKKKILFLEQKSIDVSGEK